MALTVEQIIALANNLVANRLDPYTPLNPGSIQQSDMDCLNRAIRTISTRAFIVLQNSAITLVAGQNTYSPLDPAFTAVKMHTVVYVQIGGQTLRESDSALPGLYAPTEIEIMDPTWRTNSSQGLPFAACQMADNSLVLYPTPDASTAALGTNSITGAIIAPDMLLSQTSSYPTYIPEQLHEPLAYLTAINATEPNATDETQMALLQRYDQRQSAIVELVRKENFGLWNFRGGTRGVKMPQYRWI